MKILPNKILKYIHVNQHKIRSNLKNNVNEPAITIKQRKNNFYASKVVIKDSDVEILQSSTDKPILSCGARVVIKTYGEVHYE
tara:strand:+ start:397 stop:645 length:249 start_codon:yes stop_codon:yes gene_type:complete